VRTPDESFARPRKSLRPARTTKELPARGPDGLKRLTLDLPEALHRAIKHEAVEQGVTMAEMLRALLLKHYRLTERTR
jgi:hypothetical protein